MRDIPEHRVVAGVDGSEESWTPLDLAAREALLRHSPLSLLSTPGGLSGRFHPHLASAIRRLRASQPGLVVTARVTHGDIAEALIEESRAAALVVAGRTLLDGGPRTGPGARESAASASQHGSASGRVAAHAFCPTVLVPPVGAPPPDGPVLIGLDVSPNDEPAIAFAFEEAALRDVPLVAVHVWSGVPGTALGAINPFAYDLRQAHATADRLLAEILAGWAGKYPAVPVRRMPLYDVNPAQTLLQASAGVGLAVVGANRHGTRTPHLLGPVTRSLLDKADCPVAVVHRVGR